MQTKIKATRATAKKATESAPATDATAIAPLPPVATDAPATDAPAYKTGTRDAATVTAMRTNFAQYSDRDSAYLAFFGSVMRGAGHSATLADIHKAGTPAPGKADRRSNPFYTGSAKATDAGAINRLVKAGYFTVSDNGNRLAATDKATASKLYTGA
jgi:hypothetical protein